MKDTFVKYIVVGAGLSGLSAAYTLQKSGRTDLLVLEARDRAGGRIRTKNHIDFGATWFQSHHEAVHGLLDELGIEKFHQYSKGKSVLVYSTMAPEHYFESDPNASSAYRIAGGSRALIQGLEATLSGKVVMNATVEAIEASTEQLTLVTNQGRFRAQRLILALPPKIVPRIQFEPPLPEALQASMRKTHTWMSNAIKVGLTFAKPFWREKGFSGMLIGQVGAVTELYDHTDYHGKYYALMGFVNEGLRDVGKEERKRRILDYLTKYLGDEVGGYIGYEEKDWSRDHYTSCNTIKSVYMSPAYGNPLFEKAYMNGRLFFAGAETAKVYGGYMDGAISSGVRAARKLLDKVC